MTGQVLGFVHAGGSFKVARKPTKPFSAYTLLTNSVTGYSLLQLRHARSEAMVLGGYSRQSRRSVIFCFTRPIFITIVQLRSAAKVSFVLRWVSAATQVEKASRLLPYPHPRLHSE